MSSNRPSSRSHPRLARWRLRSRLPPTSTTCSTSCSSPPDGLRRAGSINGPSTDFRATWSPIKFRAARFTSRRRDRLCCRHPHAPMERRRILARRDVSRRLYSSIAVRREARGLGLELLKMAERVTAASGPQDRFASTVSPVTPLFAIITSAPDSSAAPTSKIDPRGDPTVPNRTAVSSRVSTKSRCRDPTDSSLFPKFLLD